MTGGAGRTTRGAPTIWCGGPVRVVNRAGGYEVWECESVAHLRLALANSENIAILPAAFVPRAGVTMFPISFSNPRWLRRFGDDVPAPRLLVYAESQSSHVSPPMLRFSGPALGFGRTAIRTVRRRYLRIADRDAWLLKVSVHHGHPRYPWDGFVEVLLVDASDAWIVTSMVSGGSAFDCYIGVGDCSRATDLECHNTLACDAPMWQTGLLKTPPRFWLTDHIRGVESVDRQRGSVVRSHDPAFPCVLRSRGHFPTRWGTCADEPGGIGLGHIALFGVERVPHHEATSPSMVSD